MGAIYSTVAVVGAGLIGGSFGMALRRRGLARRVIGIGRRESSLQEALAAGALDEATLDVREGVREADLVMLATPIGAFERLMPELAGGMKRGAVLTDAASTKQCVIQTVTRALKDRPDIAYIPAHPMAGSEKRGAANGDADLFVGCVCIFTPLPGTPEPELERLRALWEALGAGVHLMDAAAHDRLVARISHLPHLAAAALLETVTLQEGQFAGGGLLDTTRIASGDPALWRDICQTNAPEISAALGEYVKLLERLQALIGQQQLDEVQELLQRAKGKRDSLWQSRKMG